MKSCYTALLVLGISSSAAAQKAPKPYGYNRLPLVDYKVIYTGIVPADGITQAILINYIQWTYSTLRVARVPIQGRYTLAVEYLGFMKPGYAENRASYLDEQAKELIKCLKETMVPKRTVTW